MLTSADHRELREVLAVAQLPRDVYAAVDAVCARRFGYILLTMIVLSRDATLIERVWSSNLQDYPAPERRHFEATDAAAICFREGRPFLADDQAALQANFPSAYAIIKRLGIGWGANVPVVGLQRSLGKITLSDARDRYRPGLMEELAELTPYLVMPFSRDADALAAPHP